MDKCESFACAAHPFLLTHWEITTAAHLVQKQKCTTILMKSPPIQTAIKPADLRAHLTHKSLEELTWISPTRLAPEGTVKKGNANQEDSSMPQAPLLWKSKGFCSRSISWLNSAVMWRVRSSDVGSWCKCYTAVCLQSRNLTGKKIRGLHDLARKSRFRAERGVGRERVQKWITLIMLRNIHTGFFPFYWQRSWSDSKQRGPNLNSLQWQSHEGLFGLETKQK